MAAQAHDTQQAKEGNPKLPAIHFYPGDWRKDPGIQSLDFADRGIWFEILLLMHESDERGVLLLNGKQMPSKCLSKILGVAENLLEECLARLLEYGVASRREDGALVCRRMVRDEAIRQERIKAGSKGGKSRLVKQSSSKSQAKAKQNTEDEYVIENEIEDEDEDQKNNGVHPSPDAPKRLRRFVGELKPRGSLGAVWLTDEVFDGMAQKIGMHERDHLIILLERYSTSAPGKFKKYTDHARVMAQFRQRAIEDGKLFRVDETGGPGYYRPIIKKEFRT